MCILDGEHVLDIDVLSEEADKVMAMTPKVTLCAFQQYLRTGSTELSTEITFVSYCHHAPMVSKTLLCRFVL